MGPVRNRTPQIRGRIVDRGPPVCGRRKHRLDDVVSIVPVADQQEGETCQRNL
jgi:hypothetical protein